MAPVAESIYVPNDPSCREYLRSQRPQLQTVFSHPETCVWGRVGYFLVPRELSERIGVMRVKKKGEWTKNGVPKNLLRHQEPGQKLGTGLTTRPRARARAPRARRCLERRDFAPNLGGETPVAESIYVPNDPSCREYLRSQRPELQRVFTPPTTRVAESIYVPNDPSCREYLRPQRPGLQRVFTFPTTPVAESIYVPNDPPM